MMKLALVFAIVCVSTPLLAQAPDQGAPADQAPRAGGSHADQGDNSRKGSMMKEAVQACRKQAMAKGLKPGKDMRQAVTDCVIKDHPGMADIMTCRMAGLDKGLTPGSSEMKSFVKDCAKTKRGGAWRMLPDQKG